MNPFDCTWGIVLLLNRSPIPQLIAQRDFKAQTKTPPSQRVKRYYFDSLSFKTGWKRRWLLVAEASRAYRGFCKELTVTKSVVVWIQSNKVAGNDKWNLVQQSGIKQRVKGERGQRVSWPIIGTVHWWVPTQLIGNFITWNMEQSGRHGLQNSATPERCCRFLAGGRNDDPIISPPDDASRTSPLEFRTPPSKVQFSGWPPNNPSKGQNRLQSSVVTSNQQANLASLHPIISTCQMRTHHQLSNF
jgi:hypothetical protein